MTEEIQSTRVFWRKGKKTMLCPLEIGDAPVIYRDINHPDSYSFLLSTNPKGLGFEEDWIKSKQKTDGKDITVGICTLEGLLIGTMGLHYIEMIHRTAVTGSVIFDESYRNKGYGTDAKMVLLDYAFNILGLEVVESRAIGFNERSSAYSQKCGYKVEARLRSRFFRLVSGMMRSSYLFCEKNGFHSGKSIKKDL
jgi:RimJ/RimL family protein N-acetyltransferase